MATETREPKLVICPACDGHGVTPIHTRQGPRCVLCGLCLGGCEVLPRTAAAWRADHPSLATES
jgi:hypothetical protein